MADNEWIELPSPNPLSKFFVHPDSYLLMEPEERDRRWTEDVKSSRGAAGLWVTAIRQSREETRTITQAEA